MLRKNNQAGFTYIEIFIVVIVLSVLAVTVVANLGPILLSIDIEQTANQVKGSLSNARRAAVSGDSNKAHCQFDINKALSASHPGILLESQSSLSFSCQNASCSSSQQLGQPALQSMCVSGRQFCYEPSNSYEFEQNSGELAQAHAVFVSSQYRKFAVLVSKAGKIDIAEYVNNEWRLRNDLQGLSN